MNILTSLLAFIVVFAIVVLVHEFGHFWVARRMGVRILKFSIGFGPAIWSRVSKKSGTEYALASIPLGGYIKMLDGRERALTAEEIPFAFDHQPVLKRIAIVVAGPLANFLFAIVAYAAILMIGVTKIAPIIADVLPDSPAAHAGIHIGDEIIAIDQKTTSDWQSVYMALLPRVGETSGTVNLEVREFPSDSKPIRTYQMPLITMDRGENHQADPLREWGITLGLPHIPAIIGEVIPEQPAALAGLEAGDEITAIDGESIRDWYDLVDHVQRSAGKDIHLTVKRADQTMAITVKPHEQKIEGEKVGVIGIQLKPVSWPPELTRLQRVGPIDAFVESTKNTWDLSKLTFSIMAKMFTGKVAIDNLAGPISIAQGANQSAQSGWLPFVSFLVLLSVNLGVINLLPVPMLDGGHLLYYVIEWIRGRPVSERTQRIGLFVGLFFILALMLVGLRNDIIGILK